jgi:hypothetical protein
MTLDLMTYEPVGDKKNSDFFNEYRLKIYERRKSSGLEELLGNMCAVVVQVETGDAMAYLEELYPAQQPLSAGVQETQRALCRRDLHHGRPGRDAQGA